MRGVAGIHRTLTIVRCAKCANIHVKQVSAKKRTLSFNDRAFYSSSRFFLGFNLFKPVSITTWFQLIGLQISPLTAVFTLLAHDRRGYKSSGGFTASAFNPVCRRVCMSQPYNKFTEDAPNKCASPFSGQLYTALSPKPL